MSVSSLTVLVDHWRRVVVSRRWTSTGETVRKHYGVGAVVRARGVSTPWRYSGEGGEGAPCGTVRATAGGKAHCENHENEIPEQTTTVEYVLFGYHL